MLRKRVGDVFCSNVIGVSPDVQVSDALRIMRERNISSIVVLEDDTPVGIFTERDVVRCIAKKGIHFTTLRIGEVMTPNVLTTSADTFLFEAFHTLAENKIRHLVVADEKGGAVGMVTQSDMIMHLGYEYFIKVKSVSQIMNDKVLTIDAEATVEEASRSMTELGVSFLVIAEDGMPKGVLTERDVARLAAAEAEVNTVLVREVMSGPVITLPAEAPAYQVSEIMKTCGVRRVVVVDDAGRMVGVATQTNMVQGMESKYIETLKGVIKEQGSELDRAIRELSEKTLYLDTILRSSIDMGIVATDARAQVVYFNPTAEDILGAPAGSVIGHSLLEIHDRLGVDSGRLERAMALVQAGQDHVFSFEAHHKSGPRHIQARVSGIRGRQGSVGLVLMLQDITGRKQAEEIIRHLAYYDTLTDLPNRALFNDRFGRDLARAERNKTPLAVMVMDVDRFKDVNDTLGHMAGDIVLQTVAERLRGLLRKADTLARVGGDEFMFLLPEIGSVEDARALADKVLDRLAPPFDLEGHLALLTFSLGIALFPHDGRDAEELVRNADKAMYRAKEMGKSVRASHVCVCRE